MHLLGRVHNVRQHAWLVIILVLYFRWTTRWETIVYTKEKKPLNDHQEDLKSLEEEYNHIREEWRITWENRKRCVMLSSCHTKIPVLISIISVEALFNHSWKSTCFTTVGQIRIPSQLPGRQELLPLQLVICFLHQSWSVTSSITDGHVFVP